MLPFYVDSIETDVSRLPAQNTYDYFVLNYSAAFHLNPMLVKAETYDESGFNPSIISAHDSPPGVCGTGHSYGLLQYTPTCFVLVSGFGTTHRYAPNAEVLYGQNNGKPIIQCLSTCSKGDYFVIESSDVSSGFITSVLVMSARFVGWNNSVFNPGMNLFVVMQIEHNDIQVMISEGFKGCSYSQYNEMALGQYQQSVTPAIRGCGRMNAPATAYVDQVVGTYYAALALHSVYGWYDEYK